MASAPVSNQTRVTWAISIPYNAPLLALALLMLVEDNVSCSHRAAWHVVGYVSHMGLWVMGP